MTIRIFKKDITPTFIEYESALDDPLLLTLFSNIVTLPPGTVTVKREDNRLTILAPSAEQATIYKFCQKIESQLMRFERR